MVKYIHFIICFCIFLIFINACNSEDKTQKVYSRSGVLVSEISMKDGVRNGPATNYYESGKVQSVINFENGKQQGESIWYYEDGKPYQVTWYENGEEEGVQKKYYRSGRLLAEVPYHKGKQQIGMKEYTETGELITDYPEIVFEKPLKTSPSGQFILKMHLSDNSEEVVFEQVVTNTSGDTLMADVPVREGIGEIPFFVEKGKSVAAQIQIRAKTRTQLKNIYITERQYYVRIKN
jgi:hypothetical protein